MGGSPAGPASSASPATLSSVQPSHTSPSSPSSSQTATRKTRRNHQPAPTPAPGSCSTLAPPFIALSRVSAVSPEWCPPSQKLSEKSLESKNRNITNIYCCEIYLGK